MGLCKSGAYRKGPASAGPSFSFCMPMNSFKLLIVFCQNFMFLPMINNCMDLYTISFSPTEERNEDREVFAIKDQPHSQELIFWA